MATLKLKKPTHPKEPARGPHTPARGAGSAPRKRPTLAQAQAERADREARYQEQLRQRFGDKPPASFVRRGEPAGAGDATSGRTVRRDSARDVEPRNARRDTRPFDAPPPRHRARDQSAAPDAPPRRRTPHTTAPSGGTNTAFDARRDQPRKSATTPHAPDARGSRVMPTDPRDARTSRDTRLQRDTRDARRTPPGDARSKPRQAPLARPTPDGRRPRPLNESRRDDDRDAPSHPEVPGSMRLSKRMSELGIASRREADEWIAKGWVRVDDHVVSELGSRVLPGQRITVDAKAKHQQAQKVTVLLNKPVGYVSGQAEDGYEPAVVLVTPANQWVDDRSGIRFLREHLRGIAPAGRLDIDSVGLLVLTQDGRIAKQLIGDDSDIEKEYLVRVATREGQRLPEDKLELLRHGLELDGEPLRPAQVEWVNDDQLRFVLREGKKRQIRRMCDAVGLQVLGLKRVRIGGVMLGDLPPGKWRYLRPDERFG